MRKNLVRSFSIVVGIIAILLIAPTVCAVSMDMTVATHDSGSYLQYFSTSPSPLLRHILLSTLAEQVTPPNRLIPNEEICLSWSPADLTIEPSPTEERPLQIEARDLAPPSYPVEYHCRNLDSEEPPLL